MTFLYTPFYFDFFDVFSGAASVEELILLLNVSSTFGSS